MDDNMMPPDDLDGDENPVASNVEDGKDMNGPDGVNQSLVNDFKTKIQQVMPNLQAMGQFESMLQQNPQLAQMIAALSPELVMAFVQVAQQMQQGGGGANPPGQADGAMAPSGPPDSQGQQPPPAAGGGQPPPPPQAGSSPPGAAIPGMGGGASGPMPPPAVTSGGNPLPSMPDQSGLRRQFFTGR